MILECLRMGQHAWLPLRAKLLVAVSGGVDSVVLLHALHALREDYDWTLVVAHIHHGLRGAENDYEEQSVRSLARALRLAFVVEYLRLTPAQARPAAARTARYRALCRLAMVQGTTRIVLAHHADDQVETIMLHLLRGTGPAGLAGMRPLQQWGGACLVRPLLSVSRQAISAYATKYRLPYCDDSSNARLDQARNRLRHVVVQDFPAYNPSYRVAFLRLAATVQAEEEFWEQMVHEVCTQIVQHRTSEGWVLDRSMYVGLPLALQRRALRCVLLRVLDCELPWSLIELLRKVAVGNAPMRQVDLPGTGRFERCYQQLRILVRCRGDLPAPRMVTHELATPGKVEEPGWTGIVEARILPISEAEHWPVPPHTEVAVFDAKALPPSLQVRTRRPGDRMTCVGMQGRKKLKKLLMEAQVPLTMRDRLPLVLAGQLILWVPGIRHACAAKVNVRTQTCLVLLYRPHHWVDK